MLVTTSTLITRERTMRAMLSVTAILATVAAIVVLCWGPLWAWLANGFLPFVLVITVLVPVGAHGGAAVRGALRTTGGTDSLPEDQARLFAAVFASARHGALAAGTLALAAHVHNLSRIFYDLTAVGPMVALLALPTVYATVIAELIAAPLERGIAARGGLPAPSTGAGAPLLVLATLATFVVALSAHSLLDG